MMSDVSLTAQDKLAAPLEPAVAPSDPPRFARRLLRRKLALACVVYLAVVVGIAIVAPIALSNVSSQFGGDLSAASQGPSADYLLGTDRLGRDILDRLLVGTRVTMVGVAEALVVVLMLGVPLGLAAGFFGGRTDRATGWFTDLTFSLPGLMLILVVLSVFPGSMAAAMVTLGVLAAPGLIRVVRSVTLPVREELYIAAARVGGLSRPYIVGRHVLPRIAGPVIVQASLLAAIALLVQTGLAFLSLVSPPPEPSWGGMVAEGVQVLALDPWLLWPPGIVIALTVLAFGLLGDLTRDATTENWSVPLRPKRGRRRQLSASVSAKSSLADLHIPPAALLSVHGLSVAFTSANGSAVRVVDHVSFDVQAGETVGVVGESGCGKTATAFAIIGLLPGSGRIESGQVLFEGRDLISMRERDLRKVRGRGIGFISQEPMVSLNPAFRVGWQLAEAVRRHQGLSISDAEERVRELLRRVHLPDPDMVARRYPHELSGGMAQRVGIARALAGEPKLLIADEPTTALDVTVQAEILDLLRELQREHQMAILLISHDWGVVADLCNRAVVLYAGQVVERAEVVPVFQQPLHPYTKALLASNPVNADGGGLLPTIPGSVPKPGEWPSGCHFHPRCSYATEACRAQEIPLLAVGDERETRCVHHEQLLKSE